MCHSSISQFYPLTFEPLYKSYLWGGRNLEKLSKKLPDTLVAESWEISAHPDGLSIVADGPFKGRTLLDLADAFGESFFGTLCCNQYGRRFPLLFKLIDANDRLSVQVHPQDDYARIHENDSGKTEMWYVIDAQPEASLLYGLNREVTRQELEKALEEGRINDLLKSIPVKNGDILFIPAGTIHSIGKGILIAELQQNSNATYRLYDYGRKNPDGTLRPLHIEKALDVIDYANLSQVNRIDGLTYENDGLAIRIVIADPHFCAEIVDVAGKAALFADSRSFAAYTFLEGEAVLSWETGAKTVKAGDSVLIPANLGIYQFKGHAKALRAYVGDRDQDIVKPLLKAGYTPEQMSSRIGGLNRWFSSIAHI